MLDSLTLLAEIKYKLKAKQNLQCEDNEGEIGWS